MVNSRFIFQHDGRGEIIWMSYEDDLKTVPCRLKQRGRAVTRIRSQAPYPLTR